MVELALRLLPVSILAVFPSFLLKAGGFLKELMKLYRSGRDDTRAPVSSERFVADQ